MLIAPSVHSGSGTTWVSFDKGLTFSEATHKITTHYMDQYTYHNGVWVATNDSGDIYTTPNPMTTPWTFTDRANGANNMAAYGGIFLGCSDSGTERAMSNKAV
jgi:hypothetical protein